MSSLVTLDLFSVYARVKAAMKKFYRVLVGLTILVGILLFLTGVAYYFWTRSNFITDYYNYVVLGGKNLTRIPVKNTASLYTVNTDKGISVLLKTYPLREGYGMSFGGHDGLISIIGDVVGVDGEKLTLNVDPPSIAKSNAFTARKISVWLLPQTEIEIDRIEDDKIKHVPAILTFWKNNFTKFNKHVLVIAKYGWLNRLYALGITIETQ